MQLKISSKKNNYQPSKIKTGIKDPPTQMESLDIRGFNHFFVFLVFKKWFLVCSILF